MDIKIYQLNLTEDELIILWKYIHFSSLGLNNDEYNKFTKVNDKIKILMELMNKEEE